MRGLVKPMTVVAAVGVFLLAGLPGEAQEARPDPQPPELKPLQRFIGSWKWQVVMKRAEWTPERTTMTATVSVNWILRGRMIEHKAVWSPRDIEGLALMTYDAENKVYRQWYFDSTGAIPRGEELGRWDEAAKTFTWKAGRFTGIRSTQTHRFIDKDTLEFAMVVKDSTGRVCLDMEGKAKRKRK